MLAGLPRNLNAKHESIHFICCSDQMDALGMSGPIADELTGLEMDGIEVYDAYLNEQVFRGGFRGGGGGVQGVRTPPFLYEE